MSNQLFAVEQRPVPNTHNHTWVAVDQTNGVEIDLPRGGNGALLGRYPELDTYLQSKGMTSQIRFSQARGDKLTINEDGTSVWSFATAGGVEIREIPRLVTSLSLST